MKVYYIWDTENNKVVTSISHRSGFYNNLVSVIFAFTNHNNWRHKINKKYVIKEAELTNEKEIV